MQKAWKCNEWRRIWVHRTFKIEIRKGGSNNLDILQNWFPPEITSPILDFKKFQDCEKSTPESWRIYWKAMNDEQLGSIGLLRLKYSRGDQIIQTFCKIGSLKKIPHSSLITRNFKTLREVLLNHAKCIEI